METETTKTDDKVMYSVMGVDTEGYPDTYNILAKSPEEAELIASYLGMDKIWNTYPFEEEDYDDFGLENFEEEE